MNPDVIAHRSAQQFVEVHQAPGNERSAVLGCQDHKIGVDLFRGSANPFTDIRVGDMKGLQFHTKGPRPLNGFVQVAVAGCGGSA